MEIINVLGVFALVMLAVVLLLRETESVDA